MELRELRRWPMPDVSPGVPSPIKKELDDYMNDTLVTQFGAPDAPYCDPATARVTIIPAPLDHSVCYLKGTEHGPQAILTASSQMELYDELLDWRHIASGLYTR